MVYLTLVPVLTKGRDSLWMKRGNGPGTEGVDTDTDVCVPETHQTYTVKGVWRSTLREKWLVRVDSSVSCLV